MSHLAIRVLGPFQASLDGEALSGFASDKVRALLVYLALTYDRPHRRETLAGLLWPEYPERTARTNLRNALSNLRRVLGDGSASLPFLLRSRQTLQFNSQSDYWLDAIVFEGLVGRTPANSAVLEQAVSLVRGQFLEGFGLADAAAFEEWLLLRREHHGRLVLEALDDLAAIYEAEGAYASALEHARRRADLEPWQESGQRRLMRLLAKSGHRTQALAQYEVLSACLWEELGVEPTAKTRALRTAIRAGELATDSTRRLGAQGPSWHLPAWPTTFFGRQGELATLEGKLVEPDTRLVTLTGPGGCGKTRLALEMGHRLARHDQQANADQGSLAFRHGIVFVPLSALASTEALVPALAKALSVRLERGKEQLLEFLRSKELLLILDNLEQLLSARALLTEILHIAPGIKIVATSRQQLGIQGEHVLHLGGLSYPEGERSPAGPDVVDTEVFLENYPALQLLAEGIRRVHPRFSPTFGDLRAMLQICRLVEGLPLALELAASWADALSLDSILAEAQRSLDFWQVDWSGLPERQRSMRAVFDASWRILNGAERELFASLTVFRGGFRRAGAGAVVAEACVLPALLASLVRKSFLRYDQAGDRYHVHELLRQYGAQKLAQKPALEATIRDRHACYFTGEIPRWKADLLSAREQATLTEMEVESENLRSAWTWAVEETHLEYLTEAMEGLFHFYWQSGRLDEGIAAFCSAVGKVSEAASALRKLSDRIACLRLWVRALAWQSILEMALGRSDAARCLQKQCLTLLQEPVLADQDTRLERAILTYGIGFNTNSVDFEGAGRRFKESFGLFRDLDCRYWMARSLTGWGNMSAILGRHQGAQRQLEEALVLWRSVGNQPGISSCLGFLAYLARMQGRFKDTTNLAKEAYEISLDRDSRSRSSMGCLFLGTALEYQGEFPQAQALLQDGLALAGDHGNRIRYTQVHAALVRVEMHRGRYEEARDHGERALPLAQAYGPRFIVGLNHLLLGCLSLAEGALASAYGHIRDSISVYEEFGPTDDLAWGFAILALAAEGLGESEEASRHLLRALKIAVEVRAVPPRLWAMPAAALLLVDRGEPERAVELYALASTYPLVAKSRWFADVAGDALADVAATLPTEQVAILEKRSQVRGLDAAVTELLFELDG